MKTRFSCVDLVCGVGGLTRGLLDAEIPVVAGYDFLENVANSLP